MVTIGLTKSSIPDSQEPRPLYNGLDGAADLSIHYRSIGATRLALPFVDDSQTTYRGKWSTMMVAGK